MSRWYPVSRRCANDTLESLRASDTIFANRSLTRRASLRILWGAVLGGAIRAVAADTNSPGLLIWAAEPAADTGQQRRYRADAQVLLLSVPLVRWPNVGGGSAEWREAPSLRFLEFMGFSNPKRAAGLNRLGFLREMSRTAPDGASESLYFGLMTASPEETADDARKALHPTAADAAYTAIDGHMKEGAVETVAAHFSAPARWSVENRSDLIERARMALSTASPRPFEGDARGPALRPFLETLAEALRQPAPTAARFAYAGRPYRLWLQKSADAKAADRFRQRGLIAAGAKVVAVTGKVRREAAGKESDFRLWVEDGAPRPLPLRIEYRARSYLRLIFEAEG
ncbi:MAG: hypothetical protein LAP40_18145 [Acidobacteriia bacterium]|nr:hypothetical protein [Terriglobia bacterium]